jgi:hypothetical protein
VPNEYNSRQFIQTLVASLKKVGALRTFFLSELLEKVSKQCCGQQPFPLCCSICMDSNQSHGPMQWASKVKGKSVNGCCTSLQKWSLYVFMNTLLRLELDIRSIELDSIFPDVRIPLNGGKRQYEEYRISVNSDFKELEEEKVFKLSLSLLDASIASDDSLHLKLVGPSPRFYRLYVIVILKL